MDKVDLEWEELLGDVEIIRFYSKSMRISFSSSDVVLLSFDLWIIRIKIIIRLI